MSTEKELALLREENERLARRAATARSRSEEAGRRVQSVAVKTGSAYVVEAFELDEALEVGGIGGKTILAGAGLLLGEFAGGELGRVAGDIGEAMLIVKAAELGREHASEDEGGGGGER